jgi:hypothetical protein
MPDHGPTAASEQLGRPGPGGHDGLSPGTQVRVRIHKHGRPRLEYQAAVVFDDDLHLVLRARWAEPQARDLGFVRLDPGDVWTEHYWRDRWYSIKEVRDLNGVLKGWYADVVRPVRVAEGLLLAEDLDLDLWLSADRRNVLRLDQDEFTASGSSKAIPPRPRRPFAPLRSWNGKPAGDSSCPP